MQFPASTAVTGRLQPVLNQCDYVQLLCWSAHTWYWRWIATQKKYLVSWIIEIWKFFFFFFFFCLSFLFLFVLILTRKKWMRRGQWKGNRDETCFCMMSLFPRIFLSPFATLPKKKIIAKLEKEVSSWFPFAIVLRKGNIRN